MLCLDYITRNMLSKRAAERGLLIVDWGVRENAITHEALPTYCSCCQFGQVPRYDRLVSAHRSHDMPPSLHRSPLASGSLQGLSFSIGYVDGRLPVRELARQAPIPCGIDGNRMLGW